MDQDALVKENIVLAGAELEKSCMRFGHVSFDLMIVLRSWSVFNGCSS